MRDFRRILSRDTYAHAYEDTWVGDEIVRRTRPYNWIGWWGSANTLENVIDDHPDFRSFIYDDMVIVLGIWPILPV